MFAVFGPALYCLQAVLPGWLPYRMPGAAVLRGVLGRGSHPGPAARLQRAQMRVLRLCSSGWGWGGADVACCLSHVQPPTWSWPASPGPPPSPLCCCVSHGPVPGHTWAWSHVGSERMPQAVFTRPTCHLPAPTRDPHAPPPPPLLLLLLLLLQALLSAPEVKCPICRQDVQDVLVLY